MSVPENMIRIQVDGRPYETAGGQSLLRACLSLGFDVPYFCWHPALESVGACRQCAVKLFRDDKDTRGRIVMSCMTPVAEGMRVSVDDREAREFRSANIEWLMLNHPHDCPVCDEGGECHLQDMTVMTGHVYRRNRFKKRTYRNQYLGPFINHEMNRCIQCYRCVRFYRDYAGGRDFNVLASQNRVYFGRHEEGVLENIFSGNLAEICPTGVFTDKTSKKHFTRPWDLQCAPSVCVHCALGCNTLPGERSGVVRRMRNRYNGSVNGYFLCDRGRFGYEFVNDPGKIREPLLREPATGAMVPASKERALGRYSEIASESRGIVAIGSPRASLEANYALRCLVGEGRFFAGMTQEELDLVSLAIDILRGGPARTPSLADAAAADAILILGEDITNTAPMLSLAVLQALRNGPLTLATRLHIPRWDDRAARVASQGRKGPLFIASPADTWLDPSATEVMRATPDDIARLGFAVAHHLDPLSPPVPDIDDRTVALALNVAETLTRAERPLIISGVNQGNGKVIEGAANVARALSRTHPGVGLVFVMPEANSFGLGLMGRLGIEKALEAVEEGSADTVIILENNLFRRVGRERLTTCLAKVRHLVTLDHLPHETISLAELVLPAATFAEATGTLVNSEGRGQRFFQVFPPRGHIEASWRWARDLMAMTGRGEGASWETVDDCIASLAEALPVFRPVRDIAPPAGFRVMGRKIPRQSHRASGRTSLTANLDIHEPEPPDDPDSPLAFSMEGYEGETPPSLITRFWAPGWNSVQAVNKFQTEVGGPLHGGDPGRRLIEPGASVGPDYFTPVPPRRRSGGAFTRVPLFHVFGSDELSNFSPAVEGLIPEPYAALNPDDAARLGLAEGEKVDVVTPEGSYHLPLLIRPALPTGTAGLPSGLPGFPSGALGAYIEIRKIVHE